jgi:hypothetical protein
MDYIVTMGTNTGVSGANAAQNLFVNGTQYTYWFNSGFGTTTSPALVLKLNAGDVVTTRPNANFSYIGDGGVAPYQSFIKILGIGSNQTIATEPTVALTVNWVVNQTFASNTWTAMRPTTVFIQKGNISYDAITGKISILVAGIYKIKALTQHQGNLNNYAIFGFGVSATSANQTLGESDPGTSQGWTTQQAEKNFALNVGDYYITMYPTNYNHLTSANSYIEITRIGGL